MELETVTLTSGIALGFGIMHALEPGHGKTALLTYLASGKRSWIEGLVISLTSAITHSLMVLLIALTSHYVFYHTASSSNIHLIGEILSLISGTLIIGLGIWIFWKGRKKDNQHNHTTCCGHSHHQSTTKSTKGNFFTSGILGVATGIIPCPTVVVAYLSGVSTGNHLLGIQSVLLFALGMSLSLMAIVLFFRFGGMKIREKLKPKKQVLNWNYIQGSIFVAIGLFTAIFH